MAGFRVRCGERDKGAAGAGGARPPGGPGAGRAARVRPVGSRWVRAGVSSGAPPGGPPPAGAGGAGGGAPFPQPVALAVAADAADFERLRRHRLFGGADHPGYLRRTERQLRALRGLGLAVHLRLLEAEGYEEFCAQRLLAPADPVARAAFAADPEYLGEPFVYAGERLAELLPALVGDHRARERISAGCTALLDAVDGAARPEERLGELLEYTAEVWLALAAAAGPGVHRLELRAERAGGELLTAATGVGGVPSVGLAVEARESEAFCVTLAAVLAGAWEGELLLFGGDHRELRGWALAGGRPVPLTALEVGAVPPPAGAQGLTAREAFPLPGPPGWEGLG